MKSYTQDGLKVCTDCKLPKDKTEYHKNSNKYDGITNVCRLCNNIRNKVYRDRNVEKEKLRRRGKYLKNKDREIQLGNVYKKNRRKVDSAYRLLQNLRVRHYQAVKASSLNKTFRTTDLLGCTSIELKKYIESKFTNDMNWENMGTFWHIDHVYPLSKINWDNIEEVKKVCHYTNLSPMIAVDNIRKGNKIYEKE